MNCKQTKLAAMEIAFGEAERTAEFDRHLESCSECNRDFAAYVFTAQGIEDAPAPPVPSLSNERLHQAILSTSLRQRPSWMPRFALAGGVAAAGLAVWVGFNRPVAEDSVPPVIANVFEAEPEVRLAPQGRIEIPEITPDLPKIKSAAADRPKPIVRQKNRRRSAVAPNAGKQAPVAIEEIEASVVPEELLAAAAGGAQSALDADLSASRVGALMSEPTALGGPAKPDIVIIQPQGQATEKSSDDVSIGG